MEFNINCPSEEKFAEIVNEFWWNVYYVPKYLWRDQLPFAKFMLDNILRYEYLHKIVDWHIGYQHNWQVESGALGKKYKTLLSEPDWKEFEATYEGKGIDENWKALLRTTSLFRRLAKQLSKNLNYPYPDDVDQQVMQFCEKIMKTKREQ